MASTAPLFPRVHTLVVCDDIEETAEEDVYNLLGVRTTLSVPTVPFIVPQICVYFQVSGRTGTARCRAELVHGEEDDLVTITPVQELELAGPLTPIHYWFHLWNCRIRQEGLHYVRVTFDDRIANERMLHIVVGAS